VFARPIAFNCIPHIDRFLDDGSTREEWKMVHETRKILGDESIRVSATAVRVPVFNGHAESVWLETEKKLSAEEAREILRSAPGVVLIDEPDGDGKRTYPTQLDIRKYKDETLVGRVREDTSCDKGLALWVVSDNLRKGAALNVVQIAEVLLKKGYVKA
jgi:aspartate-semialdehyde dehydrogenase